MPNVSHEGICSPRKGGKMNRERSRNADRWDFVAISVLILVGWGFVTGIVYGIRWLISLITGGE